MTFRHDSRRVSSNAYDRRSTISAVSMRDRVARSNTKSIGWTGDQVLATDRLQHRYRITVKGSPRSNTFRYQY